MSGKHGRDDRHLKAVPDDSPGEIGPVVTSAVPAEATRSRGGRDPHPALFVVDDTDAPAPRGSTPMATAAGSQDLGAEDLSLFAPNLTVAEIRRMLADGGAPTDLLVMIDGFGDDAPALTSWLREIGVGGTPEESLQRLLENWRPLLKRGATALDAELCGAEFFWMLDSATGDLDPLDALSELIAEAARTGTREALAMCRVLAHLGPATVRPGAATAANRLAASGAKDMPWVRSLGKAEFVSAFGYTDPAGSQQSVAVEFRYGKSSHACVVLIDHGLGGGVKDCWLSDDCDRVRTQMRLAAIRFGFDLDIHSAANTATILHAALAAPLCPMEPDQIEDVGSYLPVLRARLHALPAPTRVASVKSVTRSVTQSATKSAAKMATRSAVRAADQPAVKPAGKSAAKPTVKLAAAGTTPRRRNAARIHRIKVTLAGSKPPIWRRLEVPSTTTLADLHAVLQVAFEWYGGHLWVFDTPKGEFGCPDPELDHQDATRLTLAAAAPRRGSKIRYDYDFGDDWEHVIEVEAIVPAGEGIAFPRCVAGRRAAPPEDCGGIWGYTDLIEILGDPSHPEHADRLDWLGLDSVDDFDPAHFDLAELNEALSPLVEFR